MIYADLGQYSDTGFDKGVHVWSVQFMASTTWSTTAGCFASIGVTTEKNDELINKWNHAGWRGGPKEHWVDTGYYSYYKGNGKWKKEDVISVKLDCNNWTVTYYNDKDEIQKDKIEEDKSYYFAILSCGIARYGHFEVVESPRL